MHHVDRMGEDDESFSDLEGDDEGLLDYDEEEIPLDYYEDLEDEDEDLSFGEELETDDGSTGDVPENPEEPDEEEEEQQEVVGDRGERDGDIGMSESSSETQDDGTSARLQWIITREMQRKLSNLGYSAGEIEDLNPSVAAVLIQRALRRPRSGVPEQWRRDHDRRRGPLGALKRSCGRVLTLPLRSSYFRHPPFPRSSFLVPRPSPVLLGLVTILAKPLLSSRFGPLRPASPFLPFPLSPFPDFPTSQGTEGVKGHRPRSDSSHSSGVAQGKARKSSALCSLFSARHRHTHILHAWPAPKVSHSPSCAAAVAGVQMRVGEAEDDEYEYEYVDETWVDNFRNMVPGRR